MNHSGFLFFYHDRISLHDHACRHSIPYQGKSAQGNQSAEDAGLSGQKYGYVQYGQCEGFLSHIVVTHEIGVVLNGYPQPVYSTIISFSSKGLYLCSASLSPYP